MGSREGEVSICFGVSIASSIIVYRKYPLGYVSHFTQSSISFASAAQRDDRLKWLIRFEFLCHTHPIIKAFLRCYGLPAVSLFICVGLHCRCTSKPHSNTHLHTLTPSTHLFSHTQRSRCVLTHDGVYICVSAGEQGGRISGMETHSHSAQISNTTVRKWKENRFTNYVIINVLCVIKHFYVGFSTDIITLTNK